ncbi:AAA family ATPase [Thermicanus aegyptius]|uniref:AAA family ATPase n=1 Tax=Thermicanus aegyptius TaxID=94009 RepID=UPI0003FE6812|nr:MoxR family ATPase [Thermicanus aegyptius]
MKKNLVSILLQANIPVLLWGEPGVGKSSFVESLGEEFGIPVKTLIGSSMDPTDVMGLPRLEGEFTRHAPLAWAKEFIEKGKGIVFVDELTTVPPAVQAPLLQLVLNKRLGDMQLPTDVRVVAAANPPDQAVGGYELDPPMANRFVHVEWNMDASEFADGIMSGFFYRPPVLPEGWEAGKGKYNALVSAFIKRRPDLLSKTKIENPAFPSFPTPRSWASLLVPALAALEAAEMGEDEMLVAASGAVGRGTALEFFTFVREVDLPDPDQFLRDPKTFHLTGRGDRDYAIVNSVVAAAIRHNNIKSWMAAWEVLGRTAEQGSPAIGASGAQALKAWQSKAEGNLKSEMNKHLKDILPHLQKFVPLLKEAGMMN